MAVTALCFTLLMFVLSLQGAHVHNRDAAFRIVPDRLQVFEYQPVSFLCEGLDDGHCGIRNSVGFIPGCSLSEPRASCTIQRAYLTDSGEYWCETEGGKRSDSVNITVTAGPVILESPVLAVMEGDTVTLYCREKTNTSDVSAGFYKDGELMRNSSTGQMNIYSVSKSDEGFYKCSISDVGESPQSWLSVTETSSGHVGDLYLILRTVFIPVIVTLQLLLVGLLHYGKLQVTDKKLIFI